MLKWYYRDLAGDRMRATSGATQYTYRIFKSYSNHRLCVATDASKLLRLGWEIWPFATSLFVFLHLNAAYSTTLAFPCMILS